MRLGLEKNDNITENEHAFGFSDSSFGAEGDKSLLSLGTKSKLPKEGL